jgi:hypothetical protein
MRDPSQLIRTPYDSHLRLDAISGACSFGRQDVRGSWLESLSLAWECSAVSFNIYLLIEGSAFNTFSFSNLITPLSLGVRQGKISRRSIQLTEKPGIGASNLEHYRIPSARFFR